MYSLVSWPPILGGHVSVLEKFGLKIEDCRSQCYDGASIMSGKKSGVAQRIKLMKLWERSLRLTKDTEMRGRILGAQAQMKNFDF